MLQFKIEQVALHPVNPQAAIKLLTEMGCEEWARDHVCATGKVYNRDNANEADLAFNYDAAGTVGKLELEVLNYTRGRHWMEGQRRVSHLGMHCSEEDLVLWRQFFEERGIAVAQEVHTTSHTNEVIAGKRWYNYVIFDTVSILGVDIKFIVRKEQPYEES